MPTLTTDDGVKLYYEEAGSGAPIVFVHEFGGDHRSWEPQLRHFSRRYRCVAYNARGYPPSDVPQDVKVPQGKILRIDPAGNNSGNKKYGIPPSNPFLGTPGALAELYAIGMRDPYRFSWDNGRMFLGHIGEKVVESVYEVKPGAK